uniref:Probable polyamine transporter At1g31830 isoform X2 n=1 Tax=Tanacetum cinerariifolium TaxID=118510 RepID=A0A6L2NM14_TANCI|nr:probable polyamine transporter At1g31830 isoform X2 [Tanacetum cinerariifolium]
MVVVVADNGSDGGLPMVVAVVVVGVRRKKEGGFLVSSTVLKVRNTGNKPTSIPMVGHNIQYLVFAVIWSVPEALITAEMGTMFPEDGGYVIWVSSALGPYWGFQQGWMKWLSGAMDNALYPVLFLDYLKSGFPILAHGYPRIVAIVALTVALTYMNFREQGMLPEFFAKRSHYGTPYIGILFSASGVILLSQLTFQEIVAA